MARAYVRLNQKDKSLELLRKAIGEGFSDRSAFEKAEELAPLRAEPRFQKLLARLPK